MRAGKRPGSVTARGPKRGTLFIISALLLASALIRFGEGAGQALALARGADVTETAGASQRAGCETQEDLQILLTTLREREANLGARETALRDRMQALRLTDEEVSRKLEALARAEEELRQMVALAERASEDDLSRLTRVYETMKPKQAAALFEEMDPSFAAGFLARMRPESAAAIMAGLSPEAARAFSVVLAGRNANAPVE